MKKYILILITFLLSFTLISCKVYYEYDESKINVTTTTNIMGDLVKQIGGERVKVYSLMSAGIDPHQYIARPHDYNALNKADFILVSGLHLEGKMASIITNYQKSTDKVVLSVGDEILEKSEASIKNRLIENSDFGNNFDPHFWFDIPLYKEAAKYIKDALSIYETESKDYFLSNYNTYLIELINLEEFINDQLKIIPLENRVLVSAHDAFAYFGKEFGFSVYSLQGLSTEDQISPMDVLEVVDVVIKNNVPAIFPENSVPNETIMSVSEEVKKRGKNVNIGNNLFSDSLGDNESNNTYIKMYQLNVLNIVEAFTRKA